MESNGNVKTKKRNRIFYFDALRALAISNVILYHVFMQTKNMVCSQYGVIPSSNWLFADIWGVTFILGVDLFLMLSGALSLGREWDIKTFLGKRIPRIVEPFVFWGIILSICMFIIGFAFPDFWHLPKYITTFTLMDFLQYLGENLMSMHQGFTHFWFFWMILGTYLIMPVLNKWLLHCDMGEVEYFLVIWLITCVFDYTLFIECPIKLTYFSGPIGMVVLGYYLRHTDRKIFSSNTFAIFLIIASIVCLFILSYIFSTPTNMNVFQRYHIIRVFEVIGVFILFKNFFKLNINWNFLSNPDGIFRKSIFSIAKYSYGIYLIHRVFICIFVFALADFISFKLLMILTFVLTLLVSWGILAGLNRIPFVNKVIGAK